MSVLKSILLAAAAAWFAAGAFAQSDPKLTSTVLADPTEVSLSRNAGSADPSAPEFIGRASYRVTLKNGAATDLNRASFTANTSVVSALTDEPAGVTAPFDAAVQYISVSGENPNCVIGGVDSTSIRCDFGDSQLAPGDTSEFIVVVKAPSAGGRIRLHWTFGGDEGKGGGNGCCTKTDSVYTTLIDPLADDSTVKTHVQSFMVKNVLDQAFTGTAGGAATVSDPWATFVDLGAAYLERRYTKVTVDERETSATFGSCSAANKNQCWLTEVTIPDSTWAIDDPLIIKLERHSSIIKNGTKLGNYVIQYSQTPDVPASFVTVPSCGLGGPTIYLPCEAAREEIPLPTKPPTYVWRFTFRALHNGGFRSP
jgi:hypothetical protein